MHSAELIRHSFYLLSARVITLALNFFYTMILARYLRVDEFGKLTVMMIFLSFFTLLCDFGLNRYIILRVSRSPEMTQTHSFNFISLRILLSLIAFILMVTIVFFMGYSGEMLELMLIAGLTLIPSSIYLTLDAFFQAKGRMGISSLWQVLSTGLITLSGLLSIYLGFRIKGIIVFSLAATCLSFLTYLIFAHKSDLIRRSSIDWLFMKQSLGFATPYAVITLLSFIYLKADTIILSLMDTETSVGLFGASFRMIEGLLVIPMVLMTAFFPRMSRESISNPPAFIQLYHLSLRLLSMIAFPLGILGTLYSKEILELIYGSHYGGAASVFSVLMWSLVFMYLNAPGGTMIQTSDRFNRFIPFALGNTVLNIGLNLMLIPQFSMMGASVARLITEITGGVILIVFTSKIFHIEFPFLLRSSFPAMVAGSTMAFSAFFLNQWGLIKWHIVFLSTIIYLLILLSFYKMNIKAFLRK